MTVGCNGRCSGRLGNLLPLQPLFKKRIKCRHSRPLHFGCFGNSRRIFSCLNQSNSLTVLNPRSCQAHCRVRAQCEFSGLIIDTITVKPCFRAPTTANLDTQPTTSTTSHSNHLPLTILRLQTGDFPICLKRHPSPLCSSCVHNSILSTQLRTQNTWLPVIPPETS